MRPSLSIIGSGKVGGTLARLLHRAGYGISTIYNRTPAKAHLVAELIDAQVASSLDDAVQSADLVIIAVPDDTIETVANEISIDDMTGKAVVHVSGAHSVKTLTSVLARGAMIGSFHPAYPFATDTSIEQDLSGVTFAIEASSQPLQSWLRDLVIALEGSILWIPEGKKSLYHAALVITSNYTVTLYAIAQQLIASFSDDETAINSALTALLSATVKNIETQGIPDALTGPLARSDVGTVESHINVFEDADIRQLYIMLAQHTLPLVESQGGNTHKLHKLLQDDL